MSKYVAKRALNSIPKGKDSKSRKAGRNVGRIIVSAIGAGSLLIASAAVMGKAGIIGDDIQTGEFSARWFSDSGGSIVTVMDADTEEMVRSGKQAINEDGTLSLTEVGTLWPGANYLVIGGAVGTVGSEAWVSGIEGNLPTGWKAELTKGCGELTDDTPTGGQGRVSIKLTPTKDVEPGSRLSLADANLAVVVTANVDGATKPTSCPVLKGGSA